MLFSPEYVDEIEGKFVELPQQSAVLFNYFNNITLFHKYLDNFKGDGDDTNYYDNIDKDCHKNRGVL